MSHGSYRSSYESLVDDAEYQALSPLAQAIFHTLKLKLGQYGIAVFYAAVLEEIHARATKEQIAGALAELEAPKANGDRGWIRRERNVCWLVNGLKFDPSFTATNTNNRKGAVAFVKALPQLAIVDEFRSYYGLTSPSPTPSLTPSPTPRVSTETDTERETDTESGKRSQKGEGESTSRVDNSGTTPPNGNNPPSAHADSNSDHPPLTGHFPEALLASVPVRRFLDAFYPAPSRDEKYGILLERTRRRDDVLRQLQACLTSAGTKLDKHTIARAYDIAHLETCCGAIDAGKIRLPDKAIHVLLVKLSETWAETRALREKPPETTRRRAPAEGAPTSIRQLLDEQRAHA